jgi:CRISPR type IV-associated protein Csf2
MTNLIINATFTTIQPVSIKMPDQEGHPTMTRGVDAEGRPLKTAYIPATTLRGKLRRLAVRPLMEAAAAAGTPWSLFQVYEAMLGQDTQSEAAEKIDLAALKKRREDNHIVDLFGAGLGVKSRLSVGHLMPARGVTVQPEKFAGVRKDLDSDLSLLDLMSADEVATFEARSAYNSERSSLAAVEKQLKIQLKKAEKAEKEGKGTKEAVDTLRAACDAAEAKLKAATELMGDLKNSTKTLTSYEAIPAGIDLFSRVVISTAQGKDLALLIGVIDAFSRLPVLGGQVARGCGEVAGKLDMLTDAGVLLGAVKFGDYKAAEVTLTADGEDFLKK